MSTIVKNPVIPSPDNYIIPELYMFPSFEDAFNDDPQKQQIRSMLDIHQEGKDIFKALLSFKRTYVIAEPGYGKTRLLNEFIRHAQSRGKEAFFVDLKKVGAEKIEDAIQNQNNVNLDITNKLELADNEETVFCFDALDEIKAENFSSG